MTLKEFRVQRALGVMDWEIVSYPDKPSTITIRGLTKVCLIPLRLSFALNSPKRFQKDIMNQIFDHIETQLI